ncbi:MAG TPA: putative Ig domain-containing protein, partial [Myxococcales bacterium]|nr:putative Ig domain-containing protein [Myxococcales bacterium]
MTRVRWSLAAAVCLAVLTTGCPEPQPPPPVEMPADDLGDGTVGVTYSHTITATGGTGALSYSATGLPAGLSIDSGSGAISGTPAASGDFSVEVTATDEKGVNASQAYPLKIYDAVTIQAVTVPDATVGAAYTTTIRAQGGKPPVTFSLGSGTLPSGLTLDAATGVVSGTPDTAGASGQLAFQAREANGGVATLTVSFTVFPALSLTATLPALGNVGLPVTGQVQAMGGKAPVTLALAGGQLPPGVTLDTPTGATGAIAGTPTSGGTFTATFSATDANGATATASATIEVLASGPPSVVTTSLPNGVVGSAYLATLVAQNGQTPYTWSVTSGALPAGLTLDTSTGAISGT